MRRWWLILALAVLPAAVSAQGSAASPTVYSPVTVFDPARDAAQDVRLAVAEAKRTGKNVLLDVGGEWCIWCRRLDSLFVRRADLAEARERWYVTVKVNYSKENKNEKLLSAYPKIPGYPHLFVLDASGKLLQSQDTGALESGKGHDPEKIMTFLRRWAPKS
jgi:thiol:disulfide interchange protein